MKKTLRKAYFNPFVRVIGFIVALAFGVTVWDSLMADRGKTRVPVASLPRTLSSHLAFSPDGRWAAGCSDDGKLYVASLTLSGDSPQIGAARSLPLEKNALCAPFVWDPQGKRILMPDLVGSTEGAAHGFLVIPVDSAESNQIIVLPEGVDPNYLPAWSPDGKSVVYIAGVRSAAANGLWWISLDKPGHKRLYPGNAQSPKFSHDGNQVYFESDVSPVPNAQFDNEMSDWPQIWSLFAVPVKGGAVARLDKWNQGSTMPTNADLTLSLADGVRYVRFFRSVKSCRLEIWDWRSGKSSLVQKIDLLKSHLPSDLRWSADGGKLIYVDYLVETGPNNLAVEDLASGTLRTLAPGRGMPDVSPDKLAQNESIVGTNWSEPSLSPKGDWAGDTIASVVASASEDEDEGPQLRIVSEKAQTLLLKLP